MRLARLHRRFVSGMGLAALAAFGAGAGLLPGVLVVAAGLALSLVWVAPAEWEARLERLIRAGTLVLFAYAVWIAFVMVGDFMPPVLAMLLFLLVGESLRPMDTHNDLRLYVLSFVLLIASTAYYPGLAFAGAFVAYVALATLALTTGHLRREAERFRVAGVPIGRSFLLAISALSGVTVLMAVILFVAFPRLPRQWNVQGRPGEGEMMAGFSEQVSLGDHGARISGNPEVAFRVEFPREPPEELGSLHWRGRSYDRFDGVRWSRSRRLPFVNLFPGAYAAVWGGPPREYHIYGGPPGARVLFGLHPLLEIRPRSAIRVYPDPGGDVRVSGSDSPVYTAVSAAALPPLEALSSSVETPFPGQERYLQLPSLSPRVARLADSLTAGLPTRYARARAVEGWLKREFSYTLDLPARRSETGVEHFLFRRRAGHCEYFSTAMVLLLRSAGIPARNVNGFLGGEWNRFGGYLAVTGNDAHSWVEVWIPGAGWVPFDPTPAGSRARVASGAVGRRWPVSLWFDGIGHQWYKWVIDYNLQRQLEVFSRAGALFDRGGWSGSAMRGSAGRGLSLRDLLPWILAGALIVLVLWGGWTRTARRSRPSRLYLALRRHYARGGYPGKEGPLAFVAHLSSAEAPGTQAAERLVDLYLRARFGGEEIGESGESAMVAALTEVRRALRARGGNRAEPERSAVPASG